MLGNLFQKADWKEAIENKLEKFIFYKQIREGFISRKMLHWKLRLFARLEGLTGPLSAFPYQTLTDYDFRRRKKERCLGITELSANRAFSYFGL